MATKSIKNIFLSASVPLPERDPVYVETADIIAIRDAVIALTTVVLPYHRIIWGGHPSITPLIYYVLEKLDMNIQEHVKLYQSLWFKDLFPPDNNRFENVVYTEKKDNTPLSIKLMRERMFSENEFSAAVFIGGMNGIKDEYEMFTEYHPNALLIPVASTGGATKIVYDTLLPENLKNTRFEKDYGYMSLFQKFLMDKI
ncbi:SLOG domain-containing protein [Salegentibacter sp. F14]